MPLDRPPRPPAGAITDRVRRAVLASATRRGIRLSDLLDVHNQAEHIGDWVDLLGDVEERYALAPQSLLTSVGARREQRERLSGPSSRLQHQELDAECVLFALPDTEFLSVLEHYAPDKLFDEDVPFDIDIPDEWTQSMELLSDANAVLRAHGCDYRLGDWPHFEWIGDPKQHELTVQPALRALADPRLTGARAEFDEALRKRRDGAPKDLEDAVDEAAKSVESTLKVLHNEHGVKPPRSQQVTQLFNSLVAANKLPGYVDKLIAAAAGPRNNMAGHGQGPNVRVVPEELADASIAAAATAITFLAHYLP